MTEEGVDVDLVIRRAIGGDDLAIAWIRSAAPTSAAPTLLAMSAIFDHDLDGLGRARSAASTSRDRQMIAIAGAHLAGDADLVDALARDHLVDHPDSLIVAWLASGAASSPPPADPA